jgi:hypothetical protein
MSFPTSPFNGQLTIVNGINYSYNSTLNAWVRAPFSNYTASTTAPNNPIVGSLWYKTDTDVLYEFLSDGTDYYWFDMSTQSLAANTGGITNYLGETFAGNLTISGNITGSLGYMLEKTDFTAGAPSTITNFDILSSPIKYFTSNATTNFTANLRGNATIPLDSIVANGQSVTFSIFVPQATAYYVTDVKIDNATVPISWQGYQPVSAGTANSIDLYTFTAVKGGTNNWRVYASQTSYTHTGEWENYQSVQFPVEYLVVAGGASGATGYGGGGGAGGVRNGSTSVITGAGRTYTVTVGGGGAARSTSVTSGATGTNSTITGTGLSVTAAGGGYGATIENVGGDGGSGGGGGSNGPGYAGGISSPVTSPVQGYAGGAGVGLGGVRGAGGGGGAGGAGANGSTIAGGAGGVGTNAYSTWATATTTGVGGFYAGGGGGGALSGTNVGGAGGSGGGGAGGSGNNNSGTAGTTNTGGGGGGMGDRPSSGSSGAGGSGIVIIRYSTNYAAAASTTGSPTVVTSDGYRYYTFLGDGSITF